MGRNFIAVDISDEKTALTREMGADAAINAGRVVVEIQ
jgi:D-arabinose 1-dehydrogenase-like Zn-dependent alcohol dehydrogenase